MTIPFLGLFKKVFGGGTPMVVVGPAPLRPTLVEKPASERLSKTVLPNAVRTLSPPDPFKMTAGSSSSPAQGAPGLEIEPPVERAITLELGDVIEHFPPGFAKPIEGVDLKREISLKGSEIEKGMASGKPTVSLASIYEEIPDIFAQRVALTDVTQVALPYEKVLKQFEALQVRPDQVHDEAVPQVETPFLQVTIEDTKKFGTGISPLEASALPPVKVEPATAKTLSKAEPEPAVREKVKLPPPRGIPLMPSETFIQAPPNEPAPPPTRIPFHLPPNGTGVPASERVPASSGPPVPTSSPPPAPPKPPTTPSRIPFKITPPALRPKLTLVPGVEPKEPTTPEEKKPEEATPPAAEKPVAVKPAEQKADVMVKLGLGAIMKNLPAFQLAGPLPDIAEDVRIDLPLSLIEPQLASGRISLDPKSFSAALPENYRGLFVVDPTATPVLLPLQEVLKNLPETALKMRADQEHDEAVDHFETPFSKQAQEDAQRFGESAPTGPKPVEGKKETPEPPKPATEAAAEPPEQAKITLPEVKVDQASPEQKKEEKIEPSPIKPEAGKPAETEVKPPVPMAPAQKSDAKEFVERVSALPGVAACSITFADGLSLAGNLPADVGADGLCAMAPSMLQKIDKHMADTKLGPLAGVTLHCAKSPLTFFMQGNVCLAVLHAAARELELDTQEKLAGMVKELSQVYAQPETVHVDH